MKNVKLQVRLFVIAFLVLACSRDEKGVAIDAVKFDNLMSDPANAGKRYSIIGYPSVKGNIRVGANQAGSLFITSEPNGEGESIALLSLRLGTGKNEMYIPDRFTNADLKVYDNAGSAVTTNDKIQVSFTVDMDVKREPITIPETEVVNNAIQSKSVTQYFGQGPVNFRVDKAE
jgi:hypothetical protein